MGWPASHRTFPTSQEAAPAAITIVNSPRCLMIIRIESPRKPRLPRVSSPAPIDFGLPSNKAKPPRPLSNGIDSIQPRRSATARSIPIRVPKNPETISGPCTKSICGSGSGQRQPIRIQPDHIAPNKRKTASASSGIRKRNSTDPVWYPWAVPESDGGTLPNSSKSDSFTIDRAIGQRTTSACLAVSSMVRYHEDGTDRVCYRRSVFLRRRFRYQSCLNRRSANHRHRL